MLEKGNFCVFSFTCGDEIIRAITLKTKQGEGEETTRPYQPDVLKIRVTG
jgi:hypothetical protein